MRNHVITSRTKLARALTQKMVESEPTIFIPPAFIRMFERITAAFNEADEFDYFFHESQSLPSLLCDLADPAGLKHPGSLAVVRFVSGVHQEVMRVGDGYGTMRTYEAFLNCAVTALQWPAVAVPRKGKLASSASFEKFAGFEFSVGAPG